jgi:choloylglycine hydrolase
MSNNRALWPFILATVFFLAIPLSGTYACTDVLVKTDNHQVVSGRNMDFRDVFNSKIIIIPVGKSFQSEADAGLPGASWVSRYGYVGITGGTSYISDGMNEKGLSIAKQTLASTHYPGPSAEKPNLKIRMLCDWVLGNFTSIDEVEKALPTINVVGTGKHSPAHFALHDAEGNSAVIEFIQEHVEFHINTNGVLTNDPSFDWQLTNLKYYKWKKSMFDSSVAIPEGYFAAERFIRATIMRDSLPAASTPQSAVANALMILDSVAPPYGMPSTYTPPAQAGEELKYDFTQWTVIRDHVNLVYYYKSVDNPSLKAIDLKTLDFSGKTEYSPIPVQNGDWFVPAPLILRH